MPDRAATARPSRDEKRDTAITRSRRPSSSSARRAMRASVGPILPAAPSTTMSPGVDAQRVEQAGRGRGERVLERGLAREDHARSRSGCHSRIACFTCALVLSSFEQHARDERGKLGVRREAQRDQLSERERASASAAAAGPRTRCEAQRHLEADDAVLHRERHDAATRGASRRRRPRRAPTRMAVASDGARTSA